MTQNGFLRRELPDGLVLVGERVPDRRSAAVGIWLGVGSRDEDPLQAGAAHFVEHLVFKGTTTRTARDIAVSLERVGGSLDAFTTKESTCFYARVLEDDLPLAVEILGDLVGAPRFDPEDVERERQVILEELRGAEDNPEDLIDELALAHLWPGHILGTSILGTETSLAALDARRVAAFHREQYRAPRAVVAAAGSFDPDHLAELVARHVKLPAAAGPPLRSPPPAADPMLAIYPREISQLHLTLIAPAPAFDDPGRPAVELLAEILGGGMSSRLFQRIREELGLAYSVSSFSEHLDDCGQFGTVLSVSKENGREALARTLDEMELLVRRGLLPGELDAAKALVRGSLVMGEESLTNRMLALSSTEHRLRRRETLEEKLAPYLAATEEQVVRAAAKVLGSDRQTLVALGPVRERDFAGAQFSRVEVREERT